MRANAPTRNPSLTPEQLRRVEQLYDQISAEPSGRHATLLAGLCADDSIVQEEVRWLLTTIGPTDTLPKAVTTPCPMPSSNSYEFSENPADKAVGRLIGEYRILRKINEGGMGAVYEAKHQRLEQRVALKVVKPGLMTPAMRRRFEYEALLLARLEHPGIARIHYAGIADAGRGPQPYFAMELIDGRPLDQYLKSCRPLLKVRQRVEILLEICQAVSHAHHKGVIHRDLKPDNILITTDGKPKILDFGVARAIDSDAPATTLHTETGNIVGTVPYMAPEQIRGQVDDLDQATDVYALGVIGYELLADRMPYDVKGRSLPEAARIICDDEPSRLGSVNKSLRGDVETILLKALSKEKTRRFATAAEMAGQVRRYLNSEPLTIRPPSTWYNLTKFAKRNKALVAGAAAVTIVLAIAAAVATNFAITASRQRRTAEQRKSEADTVIEFLTKDVLSGATPERIPDTAVRDMIVKTMIEPAAATVGERFRDTPLVEAAARNALLITYFAVGRSDLALPHAMTALERRRQVLGDDHPDTIASMDNYAIVLSSLGRLSEAEPIQREALERRRRLLGKDHVDTINSLHNYAYLLRSLGRWSEAELLFKQALEQRQRILGADDPDTMASLNNYAFALYSQGRWNEAETFYRQALEQKRRVLGQDHRDTIMALDNYAGVLRVLGRLSEAEPLQRQALVQSRKILGEDHPDTIMMLNNYGCVVWSLGRLAEAERLHLQALEQRRRVLGPDHFDTIDSMNNYALALESLGRLSEAEVLLRDALLQRRRVLGDEHPDTIDSLNNYAHVLYSEGRFAEAQPLFEKALEQRRRVLGAMHPNTLASSENVGIVLERQGKLTEAAKIYKRLFDEAPMAQVSANAAAQYIGHYGPCLISLGRSEEAETPLHVAYDRFKASRQQNLPQFRNVLQSLILAADATGHPDSASAWRAELASLRATTRPASEPAVTAATQP